MNEVAARYGAGAVAVVGMAGRFPGAPDVETLWRNLVDGVESVKRFGRDELVAAGMPEAIADHPELVPAGGLLEGIDLFDARFFGYSPREAELIDPQQRLFLEACWHALENAGYGPGSLSPGDSVGVYAGATLSSYLFQLAAAGAGGGDLWQSLALGGSPAGAANAPDFFATRVAYKLNLRGPAYTVATACSTGLVAVHLACQALLAFETDLALAGAASVRVPHVGGYVYQESGILSPDGHTRPFDERARGTVFGHGVGVVALKRLDDAIEAGDTVLAVVRGTATNNDGSEKVGFTAPSLRAQAEVVEEALAAADVDPETVTLIEAHGTGTALGDPIEVAALTRAFATSRRRYCALGSIKSNLGHLDAAAGISGFIKAVLALDRGVVPPSLNFERPNPKLDLERSPFWVPCEATAWETDGMPRRAGVSSFGFGGTNAHAILEQAPAPPAPAAAPRETSRPYQLLVLSARSPEQVETATQRLASHLSTAGSGLADTAFTLQAGRQPFSWRRAVVVPRGVDVAAALADPSRSHTAECTESGMPVAFLLPGQGSQHPGMGRDLYRSEPVYRHWIDRAAERLGASLEDDLRHLLGYLGETGSEAAETLRDTRFAQPALFAVELALGRLWESWGVPPAAMLGHSVGEYVAACLSEVLAFDDAVELVALRGRLMGEMPPGSMLAVELGEAEAARYVADGVEVAAINAPASTVLAGPGEAIRAAAQRLAADGVEHRRLHTSHAFHTAMMEPALPRFRQAWERVELAPPTVPFVSCVTGHWIEDAQATDPEYWCEQIRRPVRFADGLTTLAEDPLAVWLEVGPSDVLTRLARRSQAGEPTGDAARTVLASLPHPRRPEAAGARALEALGRLWTAGVDVHWPGLWGGESCRRVALPGYPFDRQRYWVEAPLGDAVESGSGIGRRIEADPPANEPVAAVEVGLTDPTERAVAGLFAEVLGVAAVGRHDDFFELGGDSLIATRLLTRVRDALDARVPLDEVFAAPTVAGLAAAIRSTGAGESGGGQPAIDRQMPIQRVAGGGPHPVSSGQERLWFLHQLDPGTPVYNLPGALRLDGELDRLALRRALATVITRHEALRTRLPAVDGRAVQIVETQVRVDLPEVDLVALPESAGEREGERAVRRELARPFDLAGGPLLRTLLVRHRPDRHRLLITTHHTVSDGWSWGLIARETASAYTEARAGGGRVRADTTLPAVRYGDFAAWQRTQRAAGAWNDDLAWWRRQLDPPPVALSLPTDRPRPAELSHRGRTLRSTLPQHTATAARQFARSSGASLFMTLLAAYLVLLRRSSGQDDLTVGTPVAARRRPELEPVVGFFVNTLVLRTDVGGDPSFRDLVDRVRETCLGAFERQEVPFEDLVDAVRPERDLASTPLFQTLFVLHSAPLEAVELPGLELTAEHPDPGSSMFDLSLSVMDRGAEAKGGGLEVALEQSCELFDRTTGRRLLDRWHRLLESALDEPDLPLSRLASASAAERQQVLIEWNDTAVARRFRETLADLVARQAGRTPDSLALVHRGEHLSYGELIRRADRLAVRLAEAGAAADEPVGVCLERSLELPLALVAILRAGAAYLPLDPDYPADRLAFMTEQSGAPVVVASADLLSRVPAGAPVVLAPGGERLRGSCEDGGRAGLPAARRRALAATPPDSLAYVIYTSGSTGRPKGAANSHRAIVNRLLWMQERFALSAGDRVLHKTPFSFDVSVWELFWPLLAGASMVIADPGIHRESGSLVRLVRREAVTTLHFVPSMLQSFVEEPQVGRCAALRRVVVSGEALPFDLEQRLFERLPGCRLENLYGPTEAAIDVTHQPGRRSGRRRAVPIGRPVANTRMAVVGPDLTPVPLGVAGELVIGGVQLARGYRGRPALTAERFVPAPAALAGGEPGARLYRTGDLGRYLSGGEIDFLGRLDFQVKIRGFRIELGEIESVLAEHPAVREAVVLARTPAQGAARLVAYVVQAGGGTAGGGTAVDEPALRRHLEQRLPDHMIPAAVVGLERMPLTASGKVDRRALPEPDWAARGAAVHRPPETAAESALAAIWSEILGLESPGLDDNFFTLGGDSIASLQVVARAREAGWELSPRGVFRHQTLGELAASAHPLAADGEPAGAAVDDRAAAGAGAAVDDQELAAWLVATEEVDAERLEAAFPLTPVQEGMLFHVLLAPGRGVYHEQLVAELAGDLDEVALSTAWREVVRRHPALRTRFAWEGWRRPVQVVLTAEAVDAPVERLDWRDRADRGPVDDALAEYLEADRRRSFDPARAPLSRIAILRTGERRWTLVWSFLHLILDGWSSSAVLQDAFALYCGAEPVARRPFSDYLAWLAERDSASADEFWRQQLAGMTSPTPLGIDRAAGDAEGAAERGDLALELSAAETAALTELARRERLTLASLLHGAWALLLGRYSGERRVVFGTTVAGRPPELPGVERMVGMFINSLPLSIELPPAAAVGAWLREVQTRQAALQPVEHSALSEVQELSELASGQPLFESLLVVENFPVDASLRGLGGGLDLLQATVHGRTASPLVLIAVPGDALSLRVRWDGARIDRAAVERLLDHYRQTLASFAARPDSPLVSVSPLTVGERRQIVEEWNRPAVRYSAGGLLHEMFERSARTAPDAIAVVADGGHHLSYAAVRSLARELAGRIASELLALSDERRPPSGPRQPLVGVALGRSIELVPSILGILRSGAAYVPLDPEYPRERLHWILDDTGVEAVVTTAELAARLTVLGRRPIVVGGRRRPPAVVGPGRAVFEPGPQDLAYVMYTSGSTGRPKGVMIPHHGVVNRLAFAPAAGQLRPGDRFLHKASICFDVSLLELFLPLSVGGAVVLARQGGHQDPSYLAALMAREQVCQAIFPPSLLRVLLESDEITACTALHSLASSAEALPVELQERFYAALDADLFNRYGPTEASIAATSWRCDPRALERSVPIGHPIARARVYVLDRDLSPLPVGVAGELAIGGPGLARGYWRRPARTAEVFVPDPFSVGGERLYLTGDRARWRIDGAVEFLGRTDHQVKIRGFRVELGEVEGALRRLPEIAAAAVVDREDTPGVRRLVGYVVMRGTGSPEAAAFDPAALRASLAESLPEHMVPAALVELAELPLSPNGKVDREVLPVPEIGREQAGAEYRAPATGAEETLATIWGEVLGVDRVGVDDDFFALGGDSILSLRVIARANEAGLGLSVRQLFEAPTVAGLAAVAGGAAAKGAAGPDGPVPLTAAQNRRLAASGGGWSVRCFELGREVSSARLAPAAWRLVAHHPALRLRIETAAGELWQRVPEAGEPPSIARLDLSGLSAAGRTRAVAGAAEDMAQQESGAAIRFTHCLGADGDPTRLLVAVRRLAVDLPSWEVIARDLDLLLADASTVLPTAPVSYLAWAAWLDHQAAEIGDSELEAWRALLDSGRPLPTDALPADAESVADGPLDAGPAAVDGGWVEVEVAAGDAAALAGELAEDFGVGVGDVALTALARAVAAWTGSPAILVAVDRDGWPAALDALGEGLESGGRNGSPVARTVGCFATGYPVLVEAAGREVVDALLATKERLRRPAGGLFGYDLARWQRPGSAAARELARRAGAEIGFRVEPPAPCDLGRLRAVPLPTRLAPPRRHALEVTVCPAAESAALRLTFDGDPQSLTHGAVERLAQRCVHEIGEIVAACRRSGAPGYTPSDFQDIDLEQSELDAILAQVGEVDP